MSNKQWYIFYVTTKHGMQRYLLEHYLFDPEMELKEFNRWQNQMRDYFRKRTGINGGQIVAIEPSEVTDAYDFREEDGYEG